MPYHTRTRQISTRTRQQDTDTQQRTTTTRQQSTRVQPRTTTTRQQSSRVQPRTRTTRQQDAVTQQQSIVSRQPRTINRRQITETQQPRVTTPRPIEQTSQTDIIPRQTVVTSDQSDVVQPIVPDVNVPLNNPIVEVGLIASSQDNWFYEISGEPYVGLYHLHEDGTAMINEGVLGVVHELKPDEIIIQLPIPEVEVDIVETIVEPVSYETIQEVREIVSDVIYKKWFENNTLSDEQILSMQTTIRDGIKQTGRNEDEPLVFYKKDRNTLQNRQDLQGDNFEQICRNIYANSILDIESKFTLELPEEISYPNPFDTELAPGNYYKLQRYVIRYNNDDYIIDVVIAEEVILYHDESLIQTEEVGDS